MTLSKEHKAIFIDKDGTLVKNVPHNVDPEQIEFLSGSQEGLKYMHQMGYRLVVVTDQPGVAQGLFQESALLAVREKVEALFMRCGVPLAGFYYCPHHPDGSVDGYNIACECRKPGPQLFHQAAQRHRLNLKKSWVIGDALDDIEAGKKAGCRTILIDNGDETEERRSPQRAPDFTVHNLLEAAHCIARRDALDYLSHEH